MVTTGSEGHVNYVIVVIISQWIHIPNTKVLHPKCMQFLGVNYIPQ